jgi:DNA invertase Pin-like site-specific DNA recombinase
MSARIRSLAYYRMSTAKEEQQASIPRQKEWATRACALEKLEIVQSFEDAAMSGGKIDQRAGLLALLEEAEKAAHQGRPYGALVCWNLDRLSRADSIRTAGVLARLIDAGIYRIYTIEGWADLSDSTHRVLFNLKQDLGRHSFLQSLSENVLAGMARRARLGKFCGSVPPFGYDVGPDGFLVPNEYADTARQLFLDYLAGASLAELARGLNRQKIPSPRGKPWTRSTVRAILTNRAYRGDMIYNASHFGSYSRLSKTGVRRDEQAALRQSRQRRLAHKHVDRQRNAAEDEIVKEDAHPALVSRQVWSQVQGCRKERRGHSSGRGKSGVPWTLSGILHCACGRVMHAAPRRGMTRIYRYYQCAGRRDQGAAACATSGTVDHDTAVREVVALLKDHLGTPEAIGRIRATLREEVHNRSGALQVESAGLVKQAAELDGWLAQGNRNLALLPADRIPGVVEQLRAWEQQRAEISARLAAIEAELATEIGTQADDVEEALALVHRLDELVDEGDPGMLRGALLPLVHKVTLYFRPSEKIERQKRGGNLRFVISKMVLEPTPLLLKLLNPASPNRRPCRLLPR